MFGIDPGLTATGYGVIQRVGNRITPLDWGVIRSGKSPLTERLHTIHTTLSQKLLEHSPGIVGIEEIFTGKNMRKIEDER